MDVSNANKNELYYKRMHIEFEDPSAFQGTYEEKLEFTRKIRDQIRVRMKGFVKGLGQT